MAKVKCTVHECQYAENDMCAKDVIVIRNDGVLETDCHSFLSRKRKQYRKSE